MGKRPSNPCPTASFGLCIALSLLLHFAVPGAAWQGEPPLLLTVVADPPVATGGGKLLLTFTVTNASSQALAEVQVTVEVPEHTVLEGAFVSSERWAASTPARGVHPLDARGTVIYLAMGEMAPGESVQLGLWVLVQQDARAIVLDSFVATAKSLVSPVAGSPLTVAVQPSVTGTPPTPAAAGTRLPAPTASPTLAGTATLPATTPTVVRATPTARPSATPSLTPSPSPSPTVTVQMAELPPTPTPNLSSEQEQLGTLSVSIFVALTLSIVVLSITWIVRKRRST